MSKEYPHGLDFCAFAYLATKEKPCWGQECVNDNISDEYIYSCEGHLTASVYMSTNDEENLSRYIAK